MLSEEVEDFLQHSVISNHALTHDGIYFGHLYVIDQSLVVLRLAWNDIYWHQTPGDAFHHACVNCINSLDFDVSGAQLLVDCIIHETVSDQFVMDAGTAVRNCFPKSPSIVMVYNNCAFELLKNVNIDGIVTFVGINFFAVFMWYHYINREFAWKPIEKILLLLGRPYKYNRLPILYEFWKQHSLNDVVYSFSPVPFINNEQVESDTWQDEGIEILRNYTEDDLNDFDYQQWSMDHAQSLDRDFEQNRALGLTNFNGTDVSSTVYVQASVEVIPETHYDQPWFATEKTYRPIALGYPFIHAGYHFSECLQYLGFRTYEKYTQQDFSYDRNHTGHHVSQIPTAVKACKDFIAVAKSQRQNIEIDIDHNRKLLTQIAKNDIKKIQSLFPNHHRVAEVLLLLDK